VGCSKTGLDNLSLYGLIRAKGKYKYLISLLLLSTMLLIFPLTPLPLYTPMSSNIYNRISIENLKSNNIAHITAQPSTPINNGIAYILVNETH